MHSVKCTYVCGGRLLSLAAGSHYVAVAALRVLSFCHMSTTEISTLYCAYCDSALRQSVVDLWKTQCAECESIYLQCIVLVYMCGTLCTRYVCTGLCEYISLLVSV